MQTYDYAGVGARIKRTREMRKLTQEYISNQAEVNTQHISDVERGEVGLSIGTLSKICKALEVSADYILFGDDASSAGNPLHDLLESLSATDKLFIEDFVHLYVSHTMRQDRSGHDR